MLKQARTDKAAFYEKMYRPIALHLTKQKTAADDGYKPSKSEKLAVAELRAMITEAVSVSAQS